MRVELSKTQRVLCLIAIMLTNIAVMADLVIIPIISNLYKAFPDDMQVVNYIVSGPMLIVVGASLLATLLLRKLTKKTVAVIGGAAFAVGAVLGVAVDNALFMAAMRTLVGVGAGFVNVVAVALIADIYGDEKTRAKITGYYNASMSLVGMAFSGISGVIASAGVWQDSFRLYWSAIPMVIMLILFIPNIRTDAPEKKANAVKVKASFGWRYWSMSASWLIMNIVFGATVLYYLSAYIVENGLGDSSFTGLAASVKSVVGILAGVGFGFIYSKLKRNTNTAICLVSALGLAAMMLAPSRFMALVIGTVVGCAYKLAFSYVYTRGFEIVPESRRDDAVAVTTAVYGIGSFLSTYCATWVMQLMKSETFTGTWIVYAAVFALLAVLEIVGTIKEKSSFKAVAEGS